MGTFSSTSDRTDAETAVKKIPSLPKNIAMRVDFDANVK
jgi:hypothetical protein